MAQGILTQIDAWLVIGTVALACGVIAEAVAYASTAVVMRFDRRGRS